MVSKLHDILKPFLLRRIKADVEMSLPSKQEIVMYAPMTTLQRELCDKLVDKSFIEEAIRMQKQGGGGAQQYCFLKKQFLHALYKKFLVVL